MRTIKQIAVYRFGDGLLEVAAGTYDHIPSLFLLRNDEARPIGTQGIAPGMEMSYDDLADRGAVVIQFPQVDSMDVFLYYLMWLWRRFKEIEWAELPDLPQEATSAPGDVQKEQEAEHD